MTIFAVLDLETHDAIEAAQVSEVAEIIEVGVTVCDGNFKIIRTWSSLVHSVAPLSPTVAKMTGISNAELEKAPPFTYAYNCLTNLVAVHGVTTWAHWGGDDWNQLKHAVKETGHIWELPVVALNLQSIAWERAYTQGQSPTFSLRSMAKKLGIPADPHHRAGSDTVLAASVVRTLLSKNSDGAGGGGCYLKEF
jgi:DNA polymerase III epsilon subunit-like protein